MLPMLQAFAVPTAASAAAPAVVIFIANAGGAPHLAGLAQVLRRQRKREHELCHGSS